MAVKGLRNLCTPSYVYLVISVIALVVMMYQNMGNVDKYCLGSYTCNVSSTALIFIIKAVYILFWTWVLNLICKAGAPGIAWFVLLLPFILLFVILASMMLMNNVEGYSDYNDDNPSSSPEQCPKYFSVACKDRKTKQACSCPYKGPISQVNFAPYPCNWDANTCSSPPKSSSSGSSSMQDSPNCSPS